MIKPIIKLDNINKSFPVGNRRVNILRDINFYINPNDFLVIFGPSGCGKSTLLHIILGLEQPDNGHVIFMKYHFYDFPEDDRSNFRKSHIGMVYQQPNWIKALNVIENVAFPLSLLGWSKSSRLKTASEALNGVGMIDWSLYQPSELSSGQQQKVALARALITDPEVIIADEPTGNLDFESGQELMQLLSDLNQRLHKTIIMVTHDLEYVHYANSAVRMLNGQISEKYTNEGVKKLISHLTYKMYQPLNSIKK